MLPTIRRRPGSPLHKPKPVISGDMNKRPGQVSVTTEVAFCSFCGRPRTLRREERHLGTLVRATVTCETCHRTLSSTIEVAGTGPAPADAAEVVAPASQAVEQPAKKATAKRTTKAPAAATPKPATKPKPKAVPARRTTKSK